MTSIKGKNKKDKSNPFAGNWQPHGKTTSSPQITQTPVSGPLGLGFGSNFGTAPGTTHPQGDYLTTGGSNGAALYRFLDQYTQNGNLGDALLKLMNGHSFDSEMWQMFYQFVLQYGMTQDQRGYDQQLTQDQRQYDWNLLQDQRQYNDPTNTLARYMGAGVSRDAAIQLLSGAGSSGTGASSGSPAEMAAASPGSFTGTPGTFKLGVANTVINGIQTIGNMVQSGFSTYTAAQQASLVNAEAQLTQQQLSAINSADAVTSSVNYLVNSGVLSQDEIDACSNAGDLFKLLDSHKDNAQVAQLLSSADYGRVRGSLMPREAFNRSWKAVRSSRDDGTILDNYIRGLKLDNAVKSLQPELIGAEIAKIGQENKESEQRIIESCTRVALGEAQIEVLNKQGQWYTVQIKKTNAEIEGIQTQNKLLSLNYEYNSAGFPMLKQNRIDELTTEALRWTTLLRNPEIGDAAVKKMQQTWLTEVSNAQDAAYVMSLYYNSVGDFATEHPGLYQLGTCFKISGIDKLLKIGGAAAAPSVVGGFQGVSSIFGQ